MIENSGTVPEFSIGTVPEFVCVLFGDSPSCCLGIVPRYLCVKFRYHTCELKLARIWLRESTTSAQIPNGKLKIQQGPTVGINAIMDPATDRPYSLKVNMEIPPAMMKPFSKDIMPM